MHFRSHPIFPKNITVWLKGRNKAQRQQFGPQPTGSGRAIRLENSELAGLGSSGDLQYRNVYYFSTSKKFCRLLLTQRIRRDRPWVLSNVISTFVDTRLLGSPGALRGYPQRLR